MELDYKEDIWCNSIMRLVTNSEISVAIKYPLPTYAIELLHALVQCSVHITIFSIILQPRFLIGLLKGEIDVF